MATLQSRALVKPQVAQEAWYYAFLDSLSQTGNVLASCKTVGIGRQTAYDARERLSWFAEAWEEAIADYRDTLHAEIVRRGRDGWLEPVIYRGNYVTQEVTDEQGNTIVVPVMVRRYSDQLLILEARRADPAYRERIEVITEDAVSAEIRHLNEQIAVATARRAGAQAEPSRGTSAEEGATPGT